MNFEHEIREIWNRIVRLEKTVYQNFNSDRPDNAVTSRIDLLSEKFSAMEKEMMSVNSTIKALQSVKERNQFLEKENNDLRVEKQQAEEREREIIQGYEQRCNALQGEIKHRDDIISKQCTRIESLTDERNKLVADSNKKKDLKLKIEQLESENKNFKDRVNALESDKEGLEDTINNLKSEKDILNEQVQVLSVSKNTLDIQVEELQTDKKALYDKVNKLEDNKEALYQNVKELETNKNELGGQIEKLKADKESLHDKVNELETDKESLHDKVNELETDKESLHQKVKELEANKSALHEKTKTLEEQKEDLKEQIHGLETDNKALRDKVHGLEVDNKALEEKMNCKVDELSNIIQDKSNAWASAIEQYQKLMLLMYQCDSLKPLIEGFGMDVSKNATDYKSVLSFVGMLGNELTFAAYLYNFWDGLKSTNGNRKALDRNDYKFIDALNQYYEEIYGLGYDIIYYPQGSDNRFNKELMKDIESSNRVFQRYSDVYVPAVMRDGSHVEKMMKVKGE